MISHNEVISYLMSKNIHVPASFEIVELHRRNRNYAISWDSGGVFLKKENPLGVEDWNNIAIVNKMLSHAGICPVLLVTDIENRISIHELIRDSRSGISVFFASWIVLKIEILDEYIDTISKSHDILRNKPFSIGSTYSSAYSILYPHVYFLSSLSGSAKKYLNIAQCDDVLANGIMLIQNEWDPSSPIHGDIRLDNFVHSNERSFLVDWEMLQSGDPLWDYASLLASVISAWAFDQPNLDSSQIKPLLSNDEISLIIKHIGTKLNLDSILRRKFWLYVGGRIFQHGFEVCDGRSMLPSSAVLALQIAHNIFLDLDAAQELFS